MPDSRRLSGAALFRQKTFTLGLLTGQLACTPDSLGALTRALLGRLLIGTARFHFTENTFALHLLLEHAEGLIDIVVADNNLQWISFFGSRFKD